MLNFILLLELFTLLYTNDPLHAPHADEEEHSAVEFRRRMEASYLGGVRVMNVRLFQSYCLLYLFNTQAFAPLLKALHGRIGTVIGFARAQMIMPFGAASAGTHRLAIETYIAETRYVYPICCFDDTHILALNFDTMASCLVCSKRASQSRRFCVRKRSSNAQNTHGRICPMS